jgi:Rod binding domain-containing protein
MVVTAIENTALAAPSRAQKLQDLSQKLEAQFLSEMLKSAGLGDVPEGFGGGVGEEQFASFLREQQALAMTKAGGIGLAEAIFNALTGEPNERQ